MIWVYFQLNIIQISTVYLFGSTMEVVEGVRVGPSSVGKLIMQQKLAFYNFKLHKILGKRHFAT